MHSYVRTTNREFKRVLNANYSSWHQKIKLSSLCIICIYLQIFCNSKDSPICSYWMPRTNTVRFTAITSDMTRYLQAYSDAFGWYRYVHDFTFDDVLRWRYEFFMGTDTLSRRKTLSTLVCPSSETDLYLKERIRYPLPTPLEQILSSESRYFSEGVWRAENKTTGSKKYCIPC